MLTRVGIVEWARRAEGVRAVEMILADALGRHVAGAAAHDDKRALVGRARAHAWRAEQWASVIPVLHDVTHDSLDSAAALDDHAVTDALVSVGSAADAPSALDADDVATRALRATWQQWMTEATSLADAPYVRVLTRVLHDADPADRV
jgi:hypothetical protein